MGFSEFFRHIENKSDGLAIKYYHLCAIFMLKEWKWKSLLIHSSVSNRAWLTFSNPSLSLIITMIQNLYSHF